MKLIFIFLLSFSVFAARPYKVGDVFYTDVDNLIIEVVNIRDDGIVELITEDIDGATYDTAHPPEKLDDILDGRIKAAKSQKEKARSKLKIKKEKIKAERAKLEQAAL